MTKKPAVKPRENWSVKLAPSEVVQLNELIRRADTPARTVRRAKILLMSHQGLPSSEISTKLGIVRGSVYYCIRHYRQYGLQGSVFDKKRPGGPRRISDGAIEWMKSVAEQNPRHFQLKKSVWSVTSLQAFIAAHAEEAGFPEVKTISRSRLWSLALQNQKKSTDEEPKPFDLPSEVTVYWLPVYLPLLLCGDGRMTFDKIEFPPLGLKENNTLREDSEIICYIGLNPDSCRFYVTATRSNECQSIQNFAKHLTEVFPTKTKIALYRCSSVQYPDDLLLYLQKQKSRITAYEPFEHDQVPKLCASLIIQTCRLMLPSLNAQSYSEMIDRIESCLDGFCSLEV